MVMRGLGQSGGCPIFLSSPLGRFFDLGELGVLMVGLVGLLGCERGEDDVAASSGEADDRGVVAFS